VIARVQTDKLARAGKIGVEAGEVINKYKDASKPTSRSACSLAASPGMCAAPGPDPAHREAARAPISPVVQTRRSAA
jgi:hypothetical protein